MNLCLLISPSPHLSICSPSSISDSAVTSDDLLAWLRPFCGDSSLPVRPRINVLQILESNFSLRDSDVRLLLLYRTQAVLKDREVTCTQMLCHMLAAVHIRAAVTHRAPA
ncbi:neuroblastoma-amplified sequence-like protein [Lates japonicus]|uniref:Neuroblastoma-amplified sequence-like protein n=1 Tax=Lates japonicus TaxID=270547 RepID=A0AAD3RL00_LATJO|nr:neuroblastoma-amplified sequence-like protein [Lates japonicus]